MGKQRKPYISTGLTNTIATGKGRGCAVGCFRVLGGGFLGLKVWLVGVVVLGLGVSGFQALGQISEGFESTSPPPTGWTYNSVSHGTNNPRTGSRCATFNATNDVITTPLVANPDQLSFWYRRSTNTTAWGASVQVLNSSDAVIATLTAISTVTTTYQEYTADLSSYSNVKIRITDTRASGAAERYIDDFSITVTVAPVTPTKLAITNITPASPIAGSGFSVTVAAQDASDVNGNVSANTNFTLTTNGNAGVISGTTTGTITAGNSSTTVSGVILPSTGTGVTLTATRTSGDILTAGTSSTFSVVGADVVQWVDESNLTAWYTATNWSPNTSSSGWANKIAQFNNTGTATRAGINLNTFEPMLGAIEVTDLRTRVLDIGNSSGTSGGDVTLTGANVNGIPNTVLRNGSGFLLTLAFGVENIDASRPATYVLANATENVINTDGTGGITISGVLTSTAAGTLTKIGNGTLTLSGANSYTVPTAINTGTLSISTIANGSINSNIGASSNAAANLVLGGGTLQYTGANASTNRAFTLTDATTSTIDVTTNALTISGTSASTSGALTKAGNGILVLSGANGYTGSTSINAGVLNIQNNTALGTVANGTTVSSGAALEIQGDISVGVEALNLSGTGIGSNGALRNISGNNSYAGAITLAAASTIQSDAGALTLSGGVSGAFGLTLEGAAGGTVSGAIATTTGSLSKNDLGSWTLTGANTYTGTTTINGGTLQLSRSGGGTLAATAVIDINSGGTLRVSSNQTLTNLTLNAGAFLTVDDGVTLTITGTFAYNGGTINSTGTAAMAYAGTGVIIYAGSRTTGIEWTATNNPNAVTINGAAVVTLAANATTTGNLTINSTAQLVGTGFTLTVSGDWTSTSTNANPYTGGTGIPANSSFVVFNGSGPRSFTHTGGATFRNLTFSGSGTYTLNNNINISVNTLSISNGNVIVGTNTLSGSGGLTMTGGTLRLGKLGTPLPELTGTYALSGGTIELNGTGAQVLENAPSINYFNLIFSGNGTTTLDGATSVQGLVTVTTANTILDVSNNTFGGATTDFTMTAGRFRTEGSGTKPDMEDNYNLTGGVVEFYGPTAHTIRSRTYQNIEVTGTNVGNSSGNITLNSGGSFTVRTGGTFTINADAITGPTGSPQTVTIENGATFNCGNVEGLVGPPLTDPPFNSPAIRDNIENIVLAIGSTINYTRTTVSQKFTARSDYSNVTISGGGEKIVQGAITINGAFTLTDGPVTVGGNTLTLNGSLTRTGGTLTMASNSSLLFGSNPDPLPIPDGTFTSFPTFQNLTINRAGGVTLGNQPITLTGTLTLSNGLLTTTSTNLLTLGTAATATGSATSFVNGPIAKQMQPSSADIVLPVGKSPGDYQPVTLADATGAGTNTFSAEYFPTGATSSPRNDDTDPGIVTGLWSTRFWQVDRTSGTGVNLRIGLPYDNLVSAWTPLPPLPSHPVAVARFDIAINGWNFTKGSGSFNVAGPPPLEAIPNTSAGIVYSDVLSSFSPFTLGFGAFNILPVTLLSFEAITVGGLVILKWKLADAETLKHVEVEWSQNGQHFEMIRAIFPQPLQEYVFNHEPFRRGDYFYRLKIVDKKGDMQYSEVKKISLTNQPSLMITWQHAGMGHPVGHLQVNSEKPHMLNAVLLDATGRGLKNYRFRLAAGTQQIEVPLYNLPSGLYRLQVWPEQSAATIFSFIK